MSEHMVVNNEVRRVEVQSEGEFVNAPERYCNIQYKDINITPELSAKTFMQEYNCRSASKDESAMAEFLFDRATQLSDSAYASSSINNSRNNDEPALAGPWPDKKVEHRTINQDEFVNQNLNKDLVCKDDSANAEPLCKPSVFCRNRYGWSEILPGVSG